MLLSGSADGVIAVSNVSCGLVVRVVQDHQGVPITDLNIASRPVQVGGSSATKFIISEERLLLHTVSQQLSSLGVEGVQLWLAASGDRRVSLWSADWSQDMCHLLDWLTFPGPACTPNGTRLRRGPKVPITRKSPTLVDYYKS